MPLRDIRRVPEPHSFTERWLRRVFIDDWSLKLLALAITLILWFLISGRAAR